uniref:Uncharacterized protein n=1 Tax=Anopheles dirus TaxID=7168 RepID=A0A182MYK0_9DIPT
MEISLLTLALVVGLLVAAYRYFTKDYFYFADKSIPFLKPSFPFGNAGPLLMKKVDLFQHFKNLYDAFPEARIFGMFSMRQPVYVVRDPELVKQITVKDFDHFADHMSNGVNDSDQADSHMLLVNSLVSLRGQKWRDMRATLSPAFTGSKMRLMFALIAECGQTMVEHFRSEERKARAAGGTGLQMEMKDVMTRFANDVIGTAAFGIKVDSFRDPNNQFISVARSVTNQESLMKAIKMICFTFMPKLMMRLNIDFLTPEEDRFFRDTIQETMRTREEQGIFRPDMIELLMQAKKGSLKHQQDSEQKQDRETAEGFATVEESQVGRRAHDRVWTDSELIAQAFIFFFAGFETISWTLSFALFEMATNEDIQTRLYDEVCEAEQSLEEGQTLSYEKLQSLPYLDMVVSETLRKWSIGTLLNRECIRDYQYDDGRGVKFTIEKGALIFIPIVGMHYDPKYYPNPERFDPERFSVENRKNIQSGTYLPFGSGPRNCIGSRFALMETKVVLYYLLLHFRVIPFAKTQIPLKLKKSSTQFATEQGIWLEFQSRIRFRNVYKLQSVTSSVMAIDTVTVAALAAILALLYYYVRSRYRYFLDKPYPHLKPVFLLGSSAPVMFRRRDMIQHIETIYNSHPDAKVLGAYDLLTPNLLLRDPECVKQIGVKDFDYFTDHTPFLPNEKDTLQSDNMFLNSLFMLRGQKWRDMRATLSPAFTGSKMRQMFELMSESCQGMVQHLLKETHADDAKQVYEMKDIFSRFANDVIASIAFGIRVNSIADRENDFYMRGKKLLDFTSFWPTVRFMLFMMFPKLMLKLDIELMDREMCRHFYAMILDNMRVREEKGIVRNDMINILMQVKRGALAHQQDEPDVKDAGFATVHESAVGKKVIAREWTEKELVAQCFLFFLAGFDTVSTALGFLCHELMIHPDVQERLYQEIAEIDEQLGGKPLTYDALQSMRYMDMVVSESLRLWPPAPMVDRYCNRDYTFDDGEGLRFKIEKGRTIMIPVAGLHSDPKYFSDPKRFDPERFSEENRHKINTGAYLPFGVGPRNCIGSRFALMEVKSVVYYMLKHFTFERCEKSQVPLRLKRSPVVMAAENAFSEMELSLVYVIAIVSVLLALYVYLTRNNSFFKNYPIPCLPVEPLFGSSRRLMLKQVAFNDFVRDNYERFPGAKMFGMFEMTTPMFVLRDAELVKLITVKDFDYFINHRALIQMDPKKPDSSVMFTKALFTLTGQRWRSVRTTLSPTFTGSKMRQMFALIVECSENMVRALSKPTAQEEEYEVKDLFVRFTNDVIASCAFGVQLNSFDDRDNVFFRYGKDLTNFGRLHVFLKFIGYQLFPMLMTRLEIDIFDRKHVQFFTELFRHSVLERERHAIVRPDMVHLLMQAGKGKLRNQEPPEPAEVESFATAKGSNEQSVPSEEVVKLTESEMVAQCLVFFLAGFDTIATVLSFMAYEITLSADVQQQLYDEVRQVADSLEGKSLTYDALQGMRYLDMVVSETLRKWPPNPASDRMCNKDYRVVGEDGEPDIVIPKGATVSIPIMGLHYDPRYYPDPDLFDPERFNETNRLSIPLGAYLPFGLGPRNCIASRFALMEAKAIVYHLILNFEFRRTERTQVPLRLAKGFSAVFGMFDLVTPVFVVRDPDLIKQITVKDFDHFVNHRQIFGSNLDRDSISLFGKTLFALSDQQWRDMRATLSPAFTGSKMRQMFDQIVECSSEMVEYFREQADSEPAEGREVKEVFTRYTTNVIATCAFGLKVNSFRDPNNVFYTNGQRMIDFARFKVLLKVLAYRVFPWMMEKLEIDLFDRELNLFFAEIVLETLKTRELQGIVRPDMIQLLLQAKKGMLRRQKEQEEHHVDGFATAQESEVGTGDPQAQRTLTQMELVAQCLIFFLAGFDTIANCLTFLAYELMLNRDVQDRLYEEIQSTEDTLDGKPLTYEALQHMKYMDMVVSESLRKWGPAPSTDRLCTRDYVVRDGDAEFTINKGTVVFIPIAGIHHDPQYYPDPEKFEPERFSEANRDNIKPGTYLPFGIGPRNCIGSRFALMEVKAIVYHLLKEFTFERTPRTEVPVRLQKGFVALNSENGIYVKFAPRQK